MVVSVNPDPSKDQFHRLLDSALAVLNDQARRNPSNIEKLRGNKLEPYARDILANLAVGTEFEDSIELIGGQKFPDIVANKFFGVEVKTTIKNHWRTTGNSVMESTRVEEVEQIFMLFGKLGAPIEFKCRPYEECLSEIVVTHSPRYLIDMNLALGHTIFDKINTPYDTLRNQENPVREIANYYQSKLKPGQELWWIQDTDRSSSLVISVWSSLTLKEKSYLKLKAMILFPEIFSGKGDKFARVSLWLVTVQSIVCPNVS